MIEKMNSDCFSAYSQYYDLLYSDKNYEAEVGYIESLLKEHNILSGSILELGSGTGKHANLLAEKNYVVTGIERSQDMIDKTQKSQSCTFVCGDITSVRLGCEFDAVISMFHVISYITSDDDLTSLFRNTNSHLRVNGLFLFDVWYTPSVLYNRPEVRVKRMSDDSTEITRIAEPNIFDNENLVEVNYTIFSENKNTGSIASFKECHPMRHFSTPEISLLARTFGFEMVLSEEFLTGNSPSKDTWGVCYVLKKVA